MKTPEEIKKGLEMHALDEPCTEHSCHYYGVVSGKMCTQVLTEDALAYIQQLEAAHRTEYCEEADYGCKALGEARKRIAELEAQVPKWISVYDDIPVNENDMLVVNDLNGDMEIYLGWFDGYNGCWHVYGCAEINVTHWMELPEPPKEG